MDRQAGGAGSGPVAGDALNAALSVGVDVGGTFTDCAAVDAEGRVVTRKVLSTPADQGEGVLAALLALGVAPGAIGRVVHGTTVVTNLLLERSGARVVLCASDAAPHLLELRRQDRASLYDLSVHHPAPLVASDDVVGVAERRTPAGIERALDAAEIARVVAEVRRRDPEAVVIALLHAYDDPAHEQALARALGEALPTTPIVTSAAVLPEIREYERTATAVAEGYARPRVARYLAGLGARLAAAGIPSPSVMTSGGGMLATADASTHAAALALSGPAGGIVGAAAVLRSQGRRDALTIDIGGTSADAGLILGGAPLVEAGGAIAGVPIALPRVLVETVSAGGGSIAWIDDGGALRVGPRSAGARPGPMAFGSGGVDPTVTDAQIALGRITAGSMSGVTLDVAAARRGIDALAARLGTDPQRTAHAIIGIADAEMARALRRVSVERGVDPRSCTLVAFGGGGPLHACALADALGMREVLVPPHAGVLSAVGLALAPERHDLAMSLLRRTDDLDEATFATHCNALARALADARVRAGGGPMRDVASWHARARYVGQGHELEVACSPGDDGASIATRFAGAHAARYGFTLPNPVELVALRHQRGEPEREARFARDADIDATLWVAEGWKAASCDEGGFLLTREGAA